MKCKTYGATKQAIIDKAEALGIEICNSAHRHMNLALENQGKTLVGLSNTGFEDEPQKEVHTDTFLKELKC